MPITLTELVDSRESVIDVLTGQASQITLHYILRGTDSDITARASLVSSTASAYDGLIRSEIAIRPVYVDTIESVGEWECLVTYIQPTYAVGESTYEFDIGGEKQRIFVGRNRGNYRREDAFILTKDHKGLIGVTPDGVEGVEIQVPIYQFSETHFFAPATVDGDFKAGLYAVAAAPTNNAPFRGFNAYEVLFLGAGGGFRRSQGYWELRYRFAASPNALLNVANIINIDKRGWDYLWFEYETKVESGVEVKVPLHAHVDEVYLSSDFANLGIGT